MASADRSAPPSLPLLAALRFGEVKLEVHSHKLGEHLLGLVATLLESEVGAGGAAIVGQGRAGSIQSLDGRLAVQEARMQLVLGETELQGDDVLRGESLQCDGGGQRGASLDEKIARDVGVGDVLKLGRTKEDFSKIDGASKVGTSQEPDEAKILESGEVCDVEPCDVAQLGDFAAQVLGRADKYSDGGGMVGSAVDEPEPAPTAGPRPAEVSPLQSLKEQAMGLQFRLELIEKQGAKLVRGVAGLHGQLTDVQRSQQGAKEQAWNEEVPSMLEAQEELGVRLSKLEAQSPSYEDLAKLEQRLSDAEEKHSSRLADLDASLVRLEGLKGENDEWKEQHDKGVQRLEARLRKVIDEGLARLGCDKGGGKQGKAQGGYEQQAALRAQRELGQLQKQSTDGFEKMRVEYESTRGLMKYVIQQALAVCQRTQAQQAGEAEELAQGGVAT